MQKKSLEVLTKLSAVLILDLPDFIRDFILNLKNKLDAYIKRTLNKGEKSHKGVDEFEILKWLIDKISLDLKQVPKHKHKEVHAVLFTCFFTQLSDTLGLPLSQYMKVGKNPQRCVQLSASTYKKYFGLNKDVKLKFERNLNINFYPEKLW
ncbi:MULTISPECIES: transporter [unclassified Acinetobacter]|uniref:transporter n=1 Tax=Acinetobacter TaxID=469 RepID=UPI0028815513|nr:MULTISPECIES: transporter [unclassified Acinetobacter]MDT0200280.1 transporter [Acinetobacter sp. RG5]MDT0231743.1 transporter [Acinetobacter sp. RRD8]